MGPICKLQQNNVLTLENRINKKCHDIKITPVAIAIFMIGIYYASMSSSFFPIYAGSESITLLESMLPLGAVFGTLPVRILADKYGRKIIACFSVLPMIISSFIIGWESTPAWVCSVLFFAGIGCGASSVVIPMYLYEIANDSYKQNITRIVHLSLNMGLLFELMIDAMRPNDYDRTSIILNLACSFLVLMFTVPESPTWLAAHERNEEAEKVIRKLTAKEAKLETIQPTKVIDNSGLRWDTFKVMNNSKDVVLILCLIVFQQVSSLGTLCLYAMRSYHDLQYDGYIRMQGYILVSVLTTNVPYFSAALVKRLGEKRLLIVSTSLMTVCSFLLSGYYFSEPPEISLIPLLLLLIYIFAFHIGLGPVPWIMIGKMFPSNTRKAMYNLAVTCGWATLFIASLQSLIPDLSIFRMNIYWLIYGIILLICTVIVVFAVPKTINENEEEIPDDLEDVHVKLTLPPDEI